MMCLSLPGQGFEIPKGRTRYKIAESIRDRFPAFISRLACLTGNHEVLMAFSFLLTYPEADWAYIDHLTVNQFCLLIIS